MALGRGIEVDVGYIGVHLTLVKQSSLEQLESGLMLQYLMDNELHQLSYHRPVEQEHLSSIALYQQKFTPQT